MKNGWPIKILGEVCENLDSKRVPITKSKRIAGKYPYYGASGVVDHVADYLFDENLLLVSEDGANLLARTYPIAFSVSGKVWVNNHAHVLKFANRASQFFIQFYLNSIQLDSFVSGMAQPKLNQKSLNSIPVPAPPLPEQQRIVRILDEAFEGIATAKATAEKNLQNARALFESHLHSIFTQRGKGWVEKRLGELAQLKGRIGWRGLTAKEYTKKGPLFLSVHSLNYGDYVDFRDAFHISDERYDESPEIMLQKDDVLICKDGAGIGKCGIVGTLSDRTTINSSLLLIRSGKGILPKFLYRCLCSPYFQKIVYSRLNGATTPHLYQRDITEFPVFLPPLPEQHKIVIQLDAFSAEIQRLEFIYQQKLAALAALKKSLLHQAFSGQL